MRLLPFIDQQRVHHSVQQLCQVLGVVPSRHYAWRQRPATGAVEPTWATEMMAVFDHHKRR